MANGQVFKTDNTACALTGYEADVGLDGTTPQGTLYGNTNNGANGLIYFNEYQETAPQGFPLVTCRAGAANVLECASAGNALFTFLCNVSPDSSRWTLRKVLILPRRHPTEPGSTSDQLRDERHRRDYGFMRTRDPHCLQCMSIATSSAR